jgi:divalent metal cation (Fe/Co/Zn/Cd) transporter
MKKKIKNIMENLKNKNLIVIRVNKTEFELDIGDVYPIPFELDVDEDISVEEFQKILDSSKDNIIKILDNYNE